MRGRFFFGAAVVALAIGATAAAQDLDLDLALFNSHMQSAQARGSMGGGLRLSMISERPVGLELRWATFRALHEYVSELEPDGPKTLLQLRSYPLDVGATVRAVPRLRDFHASGGLTYNMLESTVGDVDDEMGFYSGLGYSRRARSGRMGFFAQAVYRTGITAKANIHEEYPRMKDDVTVKLDGWQIDVGIVFRLKSSHRAVASARSSSLAAEGDRYGPPRCPAP